MNFNKDTRIGEILEKAPEKAEILLEIGMHCLGCPASQMETLEEACDVHGIDVNEVLEKLSKEYEIFIGTSYIIPEILDETSFLLPQKYDFLRKTLPFINPHNFIFLGNKSVLNCDIKIDDRLDNLDGAKTKILFTAFHNKKISEKKLKKQGIKRVNNWKEIEQLLLKEGVTTK